MEERKVSKSLFVKVFEVVIRFILRFRIPVLIFIAAMTAFFVYQLFSLQIDANIFSFTSGVPPAEHVLTPINASDGKPVFYALPDDYVKFTPEAYGHVERPEDEKLHVAIPASMIQGKEYSGYPDGFVVIFSSSLLYTP